MYVIFHFKCSKIGFYYSGRSLTCDFLSPFPPLSLMQPTNQNQAKLGRWSQALKQGVVLKLAQSLVVACGLN